MVDQLPKQKVFIQYLKEWSRYGRSVAKTEGLHTVPERMEQIW